MSRNRRVKMSRYRKKSLSAWNIYHTRLRFFTGRKEKELAPEFWKDSFIKELKNSKRKRMKQARLNRKKPHNRFTDGVDKWHGLSKKEKNKWKKEAQNSSWSGFNLFMSKYQKGEV